MTVNEVSQALNQWAPLHYAEDFDNVGLLVGDPQQEVRGILITLDTLESVVQEAIDRDCNLIVSFHPIIFSGIKRFNGQDYVNRTVIKAIQHNIAIYAIHTALDNVPHGVSKGMCDRLGLIQRRVLMPKKGQLLELTTYVPHDQLESLRKQLFEAGAGAIGHYEECSFNVQGTGTFKPGQESNPTLGTQGELHEEPETKLSVVLDRKDRGRVLSALKKAHPYEEVAYELIALENEQQHLGMGMIGALENPVAETDFLEKVKKQFQCGGIRHSALRHKPVQQVAVLGGSGSFAIEAAKRAGADVLITADLKYHQFFQGDEQLLLIDIGHYESEQFTKNVLEQFLKEKFPNFAILLSIENTNPVNYL
ncbi:Nif3-like dinuclear metal center hexameric protein [Croceiramulus getboli]|nr:Nif3-like dinuclear metal center hexameric protein [Flavobacteriaceae bacterium YJPT1-3]